MAIKRLFNAEQRMPIRDDFPRIGFISDSFFKDIEEELKKHGKDISQLNRLNIVYPHKDQRFYGENGSYSIAQELAEQIKERWPNIEAILCDSIIEKKYFNKTKEQNIMLTLASKQVFDVVSKLQQTPLPFIENTNIDEPEYFIVADDFVESGLTASNLINYIEHNGGQVLGMCAYRRYGSAYLQQTETPLDPNFDRRTIQFENPKRHYGKIPEIVHALLKHSDPMTPDECFERLDNALKKHNHSAIAMTDEESQGLLRKIYLEKGGMKDIERSLKWVPLLQIKEFPPFLSSIKHWHREHSF